MDNELKQLLAELEEKQNNRMEEMNKIKAEIEKVDFLTKNHLARFEEGIKEDISSGMYMNTTEGKLQKMIDEEKNRINEEANKNKDELNKKLEESQKEDETQKVNEYDQIREGIRDYHFKIGMEIVHAERNLKNIKEEKDSKMDDIDKIIAEKEAKYTHLIMKNRNSMDIENVEIRQLRTEIDELNDEKSTLISEYDSKIKEQEEYIQECNDKKQRAAKFTSEIRLSTKTIKEIREILFDGEVEIENEQEEQEEQEEQKSKQAKEKTHIDKGLMDKFAKDTGVKNNELNEIFKNKENIQKISEIYSKNTPEEAKAIIEDYYMNIDSKLEIGVSKNGIICNGTELSNAREVLINNPKLSEKANDLIEGILQNQEVSYDDKIIDAILADNYKINKNNEAELTLAGEKKIKQYLSTVMEPTKENKEKCSIEYDLRGMSSIRRFFSASPWTRQDVKGFEDIAYEARDTYADVKTGPLTKAKWAIKDMLKRITTPKLTTQDNQNNEKNDKEEQKDSKAWELTKEQKDLANDMSDIQAKLEAIANEFSQEKQEDEQTRE